MSFVKNIAFQSRKVFVAAVVVALTCGCIWGNSLAYGESLVSFEVKLSQCLRQKLFSKDECTNQIKQYEANRDNDSPPGKLVESSENPAEPINQVTPPVTKQAEANAVAEAAAREEAAREAMFARDAERARKNREKELKAAEERARIVEARAAESRRAQEQAAAEHDRQLIQQFKEKLKKEHDISLAEARKAKDEEIRKKLVLASLNREAQKEFEHEKKKSGLKIAQLLQMAAVTMQAATAMNSISKSEPLITSNSAPSTKPQPGLSNRSPASLGDQADISQKSTEELVAETNPETAKAEKDQQTKAQIKEAIEAAEKRKAILALRLKNKLREKDKLAKGEKQEGLDTSELFGGSLTSELAKEAEAEAGAPASNEASFASSVYSAVKGGFSLAGAETDREVKEIVDGVQRELSSEEMSSGVLAEDSQSLFERVHAAHRSCLRQKCVLSTGSSWSR